MQIRLDGRAAIVTGACGGIGGAIVAALSDAGCSILSTDLPNATPRRGERVVHHPADITRGADREGVVDACMKAHGRVDILINNAGVLDRADLFGTTEAMWDRTMDVNVKSYFFLTQVAARVMREQGRGGSIVNMASIAADVIQNPIPAYAISKGAVRTLTYALALELGPSGIRVNAIAPGTIQTDINKARWEVPGVKDRATAGVPMRRLGVPTDIGPAVVYLSSDAASFVNGTVLVVDGGRSHNIG